MRHVRHKGRAAFTLVELLVVIAIIAVLAALLLPAVNRGKTRALRIACISDLNQVGTAFQLFAHDHRNGFPMQTPVADGGSLEYVQAGESINGTFYFSYRHFQPLGTDLVQTKPLVCPADLDRQPAASFPLLQNSNISYFVGVNSTYDQPMSILAGDRNITNDNRATASLVQGAYGLRWTSELHFFRGNVLFSDSHVEQMNNVRLDLPAAAAGPSTSFFLPAVYTQPVLAATPPAGGGSQPPTMPSSPSAPAIQPSRGLNSQMANHNSADDNFDQNPRDKNPKSVTNRVTPASAPAPATDDEPEPPLVWMLGAVRGLMARTSWWLLLLILLLAGIALYLYAKKKIRERQP